MYTFFNILIIFFSFLFTYETHLLLKQSNFTYFKYLAKQQFKYQLRYVYIFLILNNIFCYKIETILMYYCRNLEIWGIKIYLTMNENISLQKTWITYNNYSSASLKYFINLLFLFQILFKRIYFQNHPNNCAFFPLEFLPSNLHWLEMLVPSGMLYLIVLSKCHSKN